MSDELEPYHTTARQRDNGQAAVDFLRQVRSIDKERLLTLGQSLKTPLHPFAAKVLEGVYNFTQDLYFKTSSQPVDEDKPCSYQLFLIKEL